MRYVMFIDMHYAKHARAAQFDRDFGFVYAIPA